MEIACISNSVSSWGCWPFIDGGPQINLGCWCRLYRRWKWDAVVQQWYINTLSWSAPQCTLSPSSFKIYLKMRYKHILETVFDPDMTCTWSQLTHLKCLCNEIFTSFFIVFLKSTAGMMKNDVYSFFISHLIPKLSHFLYFELWRHQCDLR
jgi:hypothetical protein